MTEGMNSGVSDGRGGPEPTSGTKADPRYLYYRLYTQEGALESQNPIYSNDQFISRTFSKSVTPPRTAASLKRHLCWIEGFPMPKTCDLYLSLSEKKSVEDSTCIPLRGRDPGPGSFEFEPIALVIDESAVKQRSSSAITIDPKVLPKWQNEQRYIHYFVYNENGNIPSKTSFDELDVSLGRINVLSVPPPHTVAALKARLANVEGAMDRDAQLFGDDDGDTTLKDSDSVSFFSDACPGINEDAPLAFVHGPREKISAIRPQDPVSSFSRQLKVTRKHDYAPYDSAWHTTTTGEILKTDGVLRKELYKHDNRTHSCYEAINSSGKRAFLFKQCVTFC